MINDDFSKADRSVEVFHCTACDIKSIVNYLLRVIVNSVEL